MLTTSKSIVISKTGYRGCKTTKFSPNKSKFVLSTSLWLQICLITTSVACVVGELGLKSGRLLVAYAEIVLATAFALGENFSNGHFLH